MIDVAERLLSIRPSDNLTRVFLELSGTGAAEGAVKHAIEASGRPLILSFMGQYHGLSIGATDFGTLASRMRRNWEAFSGGAVHAPYPMTFFFQAEDGIRDFTVTGVQTCALPI